MADVHIDGRRYELEDGRNLLHACLSNGIDLPYFCWHPALGSVGACRQCAIVQYRDEQDSKGRIVMACMTPVTDGLRASVDAPEAAEFRRTVIEWLMLNHPHDCPVCEEGGECHLQDMTVMAGHTVRRYRGRKRTFENQYLGPFIGHEMNRCITCYRCVRFYCDYAGGSDLAAFGSRDRVYFGRHEDGVLENPFSGNLVEVCPTGVFTDKPFSRDYTRKWDLQSAPSVCAGCAVGCNIFPAERYGRLKRVHNRYHHELNGYFLCDRGRFGAGWVNEGVRLRRAGARRTDGSLDELSADEAAVHVAVRLRDRSVVGIGSPRASLEANLALRLLVGEENFCIGVGASEEPSLAVALTRLARSPGACPTLAQVESADAVLILGEDVAVTAPRLALSLRQMVRNAAFAAATDAGIPRWQDAGVRSHGQQRRSPLLIATPRRTWLDDVASARLRAAPERVAGVARAIAAGLAGRGTGTGTAPDGAGAFVDAAVEALTQAERPLVVSGTGVLSAEVLRAAGAVVDALEGRGALLQVVPECNSVGVGLLGGGLTLNDAVDRVRAGAASIVLENDLDRRLAPGRAVLPDDAVVVAIDSLVTATVARAAMVLPSAPFTECEGTFVNYEGRAQRFYAVHPPVPPVEPAWRWVTRLGRALGRNDLDFHHVDELIARCGQLPRLAGVTSAAPTANYRATAQQRIARQPHRYSGRTAMHADRDLHEPKTPVDEESPLSFSMEGAAPDLPALIPFVWAPGWNSNQAVTRFQQEAGGPLKGGDPGVRILEDPAAAVPPPDLAPVADPAPAAGTFTLVPLYEIFGSEELSARSPAIAERIPAPYVVMHPVDAAALGVTAGSGVRCEAAPSSLEVRLDEDLYPGCVGYPRGLPGAWAELPGRVDFEPDPAFRGRSDVIARG